MLCCGTLRCGTFHCGSCYTITTGSSCCRLTEALASYHFPQLKPILLSLLLACFSKRSDCNWFLLFLLSNRKSESSRIIVKLLCCSNALPLTTYHTPRQALLGKFLTPNSLSSFALSLCCSLIIRI